ncbi:MAG: diguanylate cyclase [Ruminococcus sp.]|nr:diguanylate cyclase [Ruminococcus sp.]MCM1381063.1 diguanylate cyclase [Muribaculaceae bacterium]MCM1478574.1 diguanylate cyclase [Muribaculaceae bacterium]
MSVEITQADIDVLRTLEPRKSILNFTAAERAATEKWAEKFQGELSEKSPFYRLIHGDWRENDESRVPIIDTEDKSPTFQSVRNDIKNRVISREPVINSDTGWNIQISRKGLEDTVHYANKHNDSTTLNSLYNIREILKNAVMLDSTLTDDNNSNKANNTAFMHKMYTVCKIDENISLAKIAIEEFASDKNDTLKRMYNMQSIEIEPLRHVAFTDKRLALSVLNGSDISISDLFQLVKSFDKNFYLNKQSERQTEKSPAEEERNGKMDEQNLLLERIAALEKQVAAMTAEQQSLKEQISTVNQFISSITESQNFEQSMSTIESMGKQVLDCGKAEFWCYDGAENKYFTNDENRGGRDWQIAKENMRIAAESKDVHIADGEAYIPIISNDRVAGILVASEKDGAFDRASVEKFSPNGQIANTIDLSLKKEFEHQGRITDELTRLKNRQGAKEYAANTMAHNVNDEKDMCLIMCDIDHFKSINDTYGHDAGDTVLKNVAGILQSGTRQGADSAFRWGGEEMVCVLNCDYDRAMDIAERLRQQIESTTHLVYNADKEPVNVGVTISMGVYQVKPDKEITQENAFSFFESQLKFADELAYKAKETGRNKVIGENDIMIEKNVEKDSLELTNEYLNLSKHLDNVYDDFTFYNSIYNDVYIDFVDNHGQLPYDLNTAENRTLVAEYADIQLEKGDNISENQRNALVELKTAISEIKEMETKLGIDENDLKFIAETKGASTWADEAQKKLDERNAGLDEQDRNDFER